MRQKSAHHALLMLNLLQLIIDITASLTGFMSAFWLYRYTQFLEPLKRHPHMPEMGYYYPIAVAFTTVVVLTFTVKHLYQTRETGLMNMDEATSVLQSLFFASAVVIGGNYFMLEPRSSAISRLIMGLGVIMGSCVVLAGRALGFKLRRYLQSRGHFFRRVIICGAGEAGRALARKLLHSPKFHLLPVAFLEQEKELTGQSIECLTGHEPLPVAGTLARIDEALEKYEADEVWIAMPEAQQNLIIDIARSAGEAGVPCRFVPDLYQIPLETLTMEALGGMPLLSIKPRPSVQPMPLSKRVFDIVFALVCLAASLPLWPLIIALLKMTSKGPIFFSQQRIGQGGRPFTMFKFRTMHEDAPAYARTPQHAGDQRITPIGRWLRKLSLDELPQFWNVLAGEMSVVGPRPEMPQIVALYSDVQRQRLCVKPGITGIWQISADRKNPIHESLDYDLYYIEKQSFFMDLMIILTTPFYGARGV